MLCELGKDGLLQRGFSLREPSDKGLRSELLRRGKECVSRPRPQVREAVFFFCWEMRNATSETVVHFKNISLKCLLSNNMLGKQHVLKTDILSKY